MRHLILFSLFMILPMNSWAIDVVQKTVSAPRQNTVTSQSVSKKEKAYFNKVKKSKKYDTRKKYIGLIENEELLYEIVNYYVNKDYPTAVEAFDRINNEDLLYKIATGIRKLQRSAIERIDNEDLLYKIAISYHTERISDYDFSTYSEIVSRITNKSLLHQLITDVKNDKMGLLTLERISDIEILKEVVSSSNLSGMRIYAMKKIDDPLLYYELALTEDRVSTSALDELNEEMLQKIVVDSRSNFSTKSDALKKIEDQGFLYKIMNDELYDTRIRTNAFNKITDQESLLKIVQENKKLEIRRKAFNELDSTTLEKVSAGAVKDKAVTIAANIILEKTDWNKEFSNKSSASLGRVIGAAALVSSSRPESHDVVEACHKYIRRGDASRIPELIYLLDNYGNVALAEDYMNCGQGQLSDAGCAWGRRHGYSCGTGYGSSRVRWGGGR